MFFYRKKGFFRVLSVFLCFMLFYTQTVMGSWLCPGTLMTFPDEKSCENECPTDCYDSINGYYCVYDVNGDGVLSQDEVTPCELHYYCPDPEGSECTTTDHTCMVSTSPTIRKKKQICYTDGSYCPSWNGNDNPCYYASVFINHICSGYHLVYDNGRLWTDLGNVVCNKIYQRGNYCGYKCADLSSGITICFFKG